MECLYPQSLVVSSPAGGGLGAARGHTARGFGAEVSTRHANFIVTGPDARAADVEELIDLVVRTVAERTGTVLTPEVVRPTVPSR